MAEYNPNARYTWTPEDKFELSGQEFGLFLNMVRSYLGSEEASRFQLMNQANETIEKIMKAGVEADVIKEVPETPIEVLEAEVID